MSPNPLKFLQWDVNTLTVSIFVLNKSSWQNHWPFELLGLIFYLRPKRTTVWSTGEFFFFFRWAKANIRQEKDGVSHFFYSPHTWLHSFQWYKTIKACPAARRTIYALHQAWDRMSFSLKSSLGLLVIFCTYKCNFFTVEVLDSCLCMLALKLPYWW